jgi:branched-chain amino acid aminotransferase
MPDIVAWKVLDSQDRIQRLHFDPPPDSLNAVSRLLPAGVYTTLRTYGGVAREARILPLEDQIHRLEESARLVGWPVSLDRQALREALGRALRSFTGDEAGESRGEARIRISVDLEHCPGEITLALEPLVTPSAAEYARGVRAVTVRLRRENPASKQASFIETAEAVRHTLPPGVNEALMVDEGGNILEGLSSNFFAVLQGEVWTPGEGVLPGITRALVLGAVRKLGLPLRLESVPVADLHRIDEAFLTGSTRSVLPVRQINEIVIGPGSPGPITKQVVEVYGGEIEKRLEDLFIPLMR